MLTLAWEVPGLLSGQALPASGPTLCYSHTSEAAAFPGLLRGLHQPASLTGMIAAAAAAATCRFGVDLLQPAAHMLHDAHLVLDISRTDTAFYFMFPSMTGVKRVPRRPCRPCKERRRQASSTRPASPPSTIQAATAVSD